MLRLIVTRVLTAIPVLVILSIVTFGIIKSQPGDYADYLKSTYMSQGHMSNDQAQILADNYRAAHGMLGPLPVQYLNWVSGIVTRFDFGQSFYYNRPVGDVVAERLQRTIFLALTCHLLASLFGITLGIVAATRQYSWVDTLFGFISFLGMTVPRFLMAIIIIYLLAFKLNVQEIGSFFSAKYGGAPWSWDKFVDLVHHIWPVVFIATFGGLAYNMRVMRANLLDVLNAQYVETARAKGLRESTVMLRHAVPNALHPLVAYQGVVLPYMLTGEVEVAIVFGLPTVGPAIVGALAVGDVWVTATFMLVLATTLIIGNIISDVLLALLDPRIRLGGAAA
jgi:peptide/nickel transport system permease protein